MPAAPAAMSAGGLSPRVRGNQPAKNLARLRRRSIPACAGEPWHVSPETPRPAVYPRVCGGTISSCPVQRAAEGLSPRVRGNRIQRRTRHSARRSIPACAGEPQMSRPPDNCCGVYPRVCGGTTCRDFLPRDGGGLSPRVRGNHKVTDSGKSLMWSIPACAGEPILSLAFWPVRKVYPRVCGGTFGPFGEY